MIGDTNPNPSSAQDKYPERSRVSNGDLHGFGLPNTEMTCYSSMSTYYFPCAENSDDSVKPDYEVKLTVEDLLNDTDRILDYALELIEKEKMGN